MSSIAWAAQTLSLPDRVVYPEREDRSDHWLERLDVALKGLGIVHAPVLRTTRLFRIVKLADVSRLKLEAMDDNGLRASARDLGVELRRVGFSDPVVGRAFALVREVARRTLGMRHYDVQLVGGFAMLKGMVAEMETGEGKTLTATLPACAAALSGIPVHIVTVNDYLAKRDADWMVPVYRALGLTVGVVTQGMEAEARRAAYRCDVTYCTNKELAFDYLRDRMLLGNQFGNLRLKLERLYGKDARTQKLLLRGLCFAIVDEIDSVLIDEARTPLIITGQAKVGDQQRGAEQALELVGQLEKDVDYRSFMDERRFELTERGKARLRELAEPMGGVWGGTILREELALHALAAIYLFARDEHYLVRDGKIQIVDEYTGRIMDDRYWGEGLHQMIEAKEGCPVTGRRGPVARITYQRVFRRYRRLCGMTATAKEVSRELWSVFHLPVATVPTNRPLHRVRNRDRIYPTTEQKWQAITQRVAELHRRGRPVLIGTRSVAASDRASHYLSQAGLEHQVLSAAQDRHEAEIISCAGELGRITIATNMAGRGTDIKLGTGVAELGGLHIIMSERHDARRIDRQFAGRCGRHGEPGSFEAILSLEDPLLETVGGGHVSRLATALASRPGGRSGQATFDRAQRKTERAHSRLRRDLLRMDQRLGTMLAFSGRIE